jgi:sugar lactone lactonase YvrE
MMPTPCSSAFDGGYHRLKLHVVVLVVLAHCAACAPVASADSVGRAKIDGSAVNPNFVGGIRGRSIGDIAVDGSHIYWIQELRLLKESAIGRADIDGSNVDRQLVKIEGIVDGIALDQSNLYWATVFNHRGAFIGRANLDGSAADPTYLPGGDFESLAVADGRIYWSQSGSTINRMNVDGTHREFNFITGQINPRPTVAAKHIYWANTAGNPATWSIGRANLDGSHVRRRFITKGVRYPTGVAVDSRHIFWTNGQVGTNTISRANLDGTHVIRRFVVTPKPRCHQIYSLVLSGDYLYWADFRLRRCLRPRGG